MRDEYEISYQEIYCITCVALLGRKYESISAERLKFKEGRFELTANISEVDGEKTYGEEVDGEEDDDKILMKMIKIKT
ncbi:hypothetical protein A2U01_0051424 [Trifolium medium]|uniref:Uncharacterized protein n=1 Tax=Trifolium medium TaxID=97028 RepID=A0A392R3T8_9FABA|nr:hypothetical protein [Trifolium medium]